MHTALLGGLVYDRDAGLLMGRQHQSPAPREFIERMMRLLWMLYVFVVGGVLRAVGEGVGEAVVVAGGRVGWAE